MIRNLTLLSLVATLLYAACSPNELEFAEDPQIKLSFSTDTVLFDTIFTRAGSITKRLKVFNNDPKAIRFDLSVAGGASSSFNIIVNGLRQQSSEDLVLLGNDSMLILVDAFIDPSEEDNPFIVEDSLIFSTNGNLQDVKLLAWGQNANYLSDSILVCNTTWNSNKPYVIFNSVLVDSLCTLTIEPGVQIFSHLGSRIFVQGTLNATGTAQEPVVFRNDRFDEPFNSAPGQWGGIFFLEGSKDNRIENAIITNSEYGIWLGTPDDDNEADLILDRVQISNTSRTGLIAFTSDLQAENLLIHTAAEFCIGNIAGGNYIYKHLTAGNFGFTFFREGPALFVSDELELADNSVVSGDLNLSIDNSVIWGDLSDELVFSPIGGNQFEVKIETSLLKTTLSLDTAGNILNTDPMFVSPVENNYRLDSLSPAIDMGRDLSILLDLDNLERDSLPDMGAYEWRPSN